MYLARDGMPSGVPWAWTDSKRCSCCVVVPEGEASSSSTTPPLIWRLNSLGPVESAPPKAHNLRIEGQPVVGSVITAKCVSWDGHRGGRRRRILGRAELNVTPPSDATLCPWMVSEVGNLTIRLSRGAGTSTRAGRRARRRCGGSACATARGKTSRPHSRSHHQKHEVGTQTRLVLGVILS
jgi:hypothetical protein